MINIIKQEIPIDESLKKKLEFICDFCNTTPTFYFTIYNSLINGKSQNPKLLTIVRICDGLGITLKEFFDDKLFDDIDRED